MKKRKKKQETINISDLLGRGATSIYLALMLGIFPLFYRENLFGISSVKRSFFLIVTSAYLCMMAIPLAGKGIVILKEKRKPEWKACDIFACFLLLSIIFSTLVALDRKEAFFGASVRKVGMIVMVLCLLSFYAIRNYAGAYKGWFYAYLAGSAGIYLCGIFVTCGMDFLNIQDGIDASQLSIFVSPLGNININAAYISLMLPMAMALFLLCKVKWQKWLLAIYLYLGFTDVSCVRSDSVVAAVFVVFALLLYFALGSRVWLRQFTYVVWIYTAANGTVFLLRLCLKNRMYAFSGLGALVLKPQMILLELLLCVVLFFICYAMDKKQSASDMESQNQILLRLQKVYIMLLLALFIAGILLILAVNLFLRDAASGSVLKSLIINDKTGTSRGYVWIRTVELYGKLPVKNKLFGCGLSNFYNFIYPTYGADMMEKMNSVFYDAHNDFLQTLVTMGIVGVVAFFGLFISALVTAARKWRAQPMQIAVVLTIAAFLVQGLVNCYSIFTLPLVFILLGLGYSSIFDTDKWNRNARK